MKITTTCLAVLAACAASDEPNLETAVSDLITEHNATLAAGQYHTCSVESGIVQCWGRNNHGQLGNGTTVDSSSPVAVVGITTAVAVTAGDTHSCAVLANG